MTHVHYKFSSKRSYNTVVFDGVNITLFELKRLIMTREKLRATDSDLQITNAQTKEEYTDDDSQIPRGSSVIVRRVPSRAGKSNSGKSSSSAKSSGRSESYNFSSGFYKPPKDAQKSTGVLPIFSQMADLATAEFSEDYKIKTIMSQSGYDSSNYLKYTTPLPANYTCYRCGSSDHHIRSCPVTVDKNAETPVKIKKSTGIPRSFMVKVDDPTIKGAMLTNTGDYAVHANDIHAKRPKMLLAFGLSQHIPMDPNGGEVRSDQARTKTRQVHINSSKLREAYAVGKKKVPAQEQQTEDPPDAAIPDELQCLICRDLLNDAVVIPCCGNSYCDDCIRSALLDSEDHVCPTCNQSDVSPDALIANKFLRQAVNNFTKEQICTQSFKSTPSTSRSQDCTPRPSPAPTPPPPSQPEKSPVTDIHPVISSDSPPSSSSTSLNVVKVLDEIPEKEADLKKNSSPAESPSVLVPDADLCDSGPQPTPLLTTVTQAVVEDSKSGSTSQCDEAPLWDRSTSVSPSEGWTSISAHPPASSTSTFLLPHSPNITPSHFQTILQQQPLSYPPGFSITAPLWPSGSSPQGTPIPAYTSSPIPPLLPKEFMLYHRRNKERTPPRGPSYNTSCLYSSKSRRSKSPRSSSRSPSRSRSHDRTRHYSPYSSHRGPSSRSHTSRSYSHKRSHSPTTTSPPSSHSQVRSRSPVDRHRSRYHHSQSSGCSSSSSSRKRRDREASEQSYDTYLRWKQEYTDWCEKYFNSYFTHFHQMPPPPLMPPPQPHWSNHSSHPHRGRSPPSTDSRSYSERSSTTTHSSSSYSDSTPTPSFSDSNSPQSDDGGSGASRKPGGVTNRNKAKESGKQRAENRKVPPKKTDKHKSQVEDKKAKDLKLSDKGKERKWREEEEEEKRHKAKAGKKAAHADTDRSRQPGRSKSPDSRSDKSKKRWDEETPRNQRQDIPIGSPSSSDLFPKALEREKTKKAVWKPQPLTKENAWEGGVKVKPQRKINININLDGRKNEDDNVEEAEKTIKVESRTNQVHVNKSEEPLTPDNGIKDIKNDSWEIFPDDETVVGGEDSDLWQCALTAVEEGEEQKSIGETEDDVKPQEQDDVSNSKRKHERTSMIVDDSCFKTGPSGSVIVCEEQQKTAVMVLEEIVEKRYLEKRSGHIKIPRSRRERDGFEKERQATVSSHHREGKGKAKRRLVEVENAEEMDDSARLDGTVAPSSGRAVTDSGFDFDRKEKKKAERESQSRKGEEGKRHKERESTSNRKSSNGSGQAFTSVLDAEEYKMHRESDEDTCREGKSRKISVELDVEWKGQSAYSKHYYHDGHQDTNVHLNWSTSHSQPDSRDRGQLPSKTFTEANHHGQNWTCPAPPTAGPSRGTALDPEKTRETRGEDSKNERKKERKKQKSHKRERRHASPDDEREMEKQNKDGGQMDLSK